MQIDAQHLHMQFYAAAFKNDPFHCGPLWSWIGLTSGHLHNHPVRGMRYAPLSRSNETRHDFFNRFKLLCLL